jgi:hypothetical protein
MRFFLRPGSRTLICLPALVSVKVGRSLSRAGIFRKVMSLKYVAAVDSLSIACKLLQIHYACNWRFWHGCYLSLPVTGKRTKWSKLHCVPNQFAAQSVVFVGRKALCNSQSYALLTAKAIFSYAGCQHNKV